MVPEVILEGLRTFAFESLKLDRSRNRMPEKNINLVRSSAPMITEVILEGLRTFAFES